ncbi:FAD-binding oxidoreductase [Parafrankia elaeagni]|uniref:FAD-binding oxidoreductase n=1 Tax=Parafrankia elaeagni TaxID=222534 RepID=UPI0003630843|nr:FAD-binding protein [Parafrankia elaeagni]
MTISLPSAATSDEALRAHCEMHLPGDPGYDAARTAWNLAVDPRPAAVAVPRSEQEVAAVVAAAASAGRRVLAMATGHGLTAYAGRDLSDTVLVRLSELRDVTVHPSMGVARAQGGAQWTDVITKAAPHGFTAPHGSAPDVGVAGYLLGGGLSFYGRRHGVAANAVRAVTVALASGVLLRCSRTDHPELFWAVRGGGAPGIVVAVEIGLLAYAEIYAGMLLWDRRHADEVLGAWLAWTRRAPESVTTSLRVMSFPPLPELPPFLSGREVVVIDGAVLAGADEGSEVLAALRALRPEIDTFATMAPSGLLGVHMDPPVPTPCASAHAVLGPLGPSAAQTFLSAFRPGLMFAELRQLGGAFARSEDDGGIVSSIRGDYALYACAVTPGDEAFAAGLALTQSVADAMAPWAVPGLAPTFTDRPVTPEDLYGADDAADLATIRRRYDPTGVFGF